jgi:hypothetical protein
MLPCCCTTPAPYPATRSPSVVTPDSALLEDDFTNRVKLYLDHMAAGEDIATVAAEAFVVVEGQEMR